MLIWATIGLTGLVMAQSDNTWVTPQPLKDYLFNNKAMSSGEFFDLNNAYAKGSNGEIEPSAAAEAHGLESLVLLGENLADGATLNDIFFGYDESADEWATVTRSGAGSKATACPLTDMTFMEKPVTGFILSATGEVYFTDETGAGEITLPALLTNITDPSIKYAARAYAAKVTYPMGEPVTSSVTIKKIANLPVAILAFGKDNLTQLPYYLVQYNYSVNTDTLIYQIKFADDGLVECKIGKQNKLKSSSDDAHYNFCLDMKRESNTLEFGGNTVFIISEGLSGWQCNAVQSLQNRCLSIYPQGGTITGTSAYTSINATVVLSEKSREALSNATSLLVFVTPRTSVTPKFENKAYAVGDDVENSNDFRTPYRVVYNGTPANLDDISFTAIDLEPNEKYYLYAYLCKKEGANYRYSTQALAFSDGILTTPMETPADVTVGELNGGNIPLTFSASPFRLLILKSDSIQSNKPQGVLEAGDRDGHVIAILDKGVTSCNIPMAPGEMTYLQMYAMTDDEIPGYSSNFTLAPLYRRAEALPLSYTFGPKDEIPQKYGQDGTLNAMPMLPPGLSTSSTQPGNAFFVTYPESLDHTFYLCSKKMEKNPAWPNVILPAFSGASNVQAFFNVKFYKSSQVGLAADAAVETDSVRIEYRLNGGEWKTAGLFAGNDMPEAIANVYPLSVSFTCKATDVVDIRYSYYAAYSSTSSTLHAIASYEFVNASECEPPTKLQVLNDETTDKAVVLTWKDNNAPATENYLVSYRKATASAPDNEDDAWETLTASTTKATLQNLETGTTYNVKVQAVCSFATSIASTPIQAAVPVGMPYVEDMTFVWDDDLLDYSTKPNLTAYNGEPGTEPEQDDYMSSNTTWSIDYGKAYYIDGASDPDALGVATDMEKALLATPAIYVRKASLPMPKTLTFRVNTYDKTVVDNKVESQNGIDLIDPALRLYVLASTNGKFTWKDTVAAFDHNALKAQAAAKDGKRGKDLSVELPDLDGLVQFAFYFHNPNPFNYDNATENAFPKYLELLGISFRYDGGDDPCFPVNNLKAINIKETEATLNWSGDGEEYGITYYPTDDKSQAKTVYQDAKDTELQAITLKDLTNNTNYTAEVISYCTKGDHTAGSMGITATFKTLRVMYELTVNISPEEAGTVNGVSEYSGFYFEGRNVKLTASANKGYKFVAWKNGETELSKDTVYSFPMPNENLAYTAVFEKDSVEQESLEDLIKAHFSLSTDHGQLFVRNLNGTLIKDLDVYGLSGNRLHRFTPNSREDLILPLNVERALIFVRINTEKGAAVYKTYIH